MTKTRSGLSTALINFRLTMLSLLLLVVLTGWNGWMFLERELFENLKKRALKTTEQGELQIYHLALDGLELSAYIAQLLKSAELLDLSLSEPELEEIIRHIYNREHETIINDE